ncbi:hypothetical protein NL676_036497 [Syzygium grande]|nr:hypothetical protein NL676_036497 [Syzygium grande]
MALRQFYNEIRGMKVKEIPNYVKPKLSIDYVKKSVQRGLDSYHANAATSSTSSTPRSTAVTDRSVRRGRGQDGCYVLILSILEFLIIIGKT